MRLSLYLLFSFQGWIVGCAHTPVKKGIDSMTLLSHACEPGRDVQGVEGSVWLKAKSREASGQFPAGVKAETPNSLKLEVTNLVGGTEAIITVDGQEYSIDVPKEKARSEKGFASWGGIPLRWATELFLGRIPCPSPNETGKNSISVNAEGQLVVETEATLGKGAEVFTYTFRSWGGEPWPEALLWERRDNLPISVEFRFDAPDDATGSPLKWEAKSEKGEVKVRWRDRKITKTPSA